MYTAQGAGNRVRGRAWCCDTGAAVQPGTAMTVKARCPVTAGRASAEGQKRSCVTSNFSSPLGSLTFADSDIFLLAATAESRHQACTEVVGR